MNDVYAEIMYEVENDPHSFPLDDPQRGAEQLVVIVRGLQAERDTANAELEESRAEAADLAGECQRLRAELRTLTIERDIARRALEEQHEATDQIWNERSAAEAALAAAQAENEKLRALLAKIKEAGFTFSDEYGDYCNWCDATSETWSVPLEHKLDCLSIAVDAALARPSADGGGAEGADNGQ